MKGIIVKSTGSWYNVADESGKIIPCRIKGKFRLIDQRLTNPIAVGDEVHYEFEKGDETGVIHKIETRRNYVIRSSPRKKHTLHLLACNVDQVFVITTVTQPTLKPGFLDRYLLTTEAHDIPTFLIFNKSDLYSPDDVETFEVMRYIYQPLGYHCFMVSAETGEGVEEIKALLQGKTTLISGHSGVGKSTLANALEAGLDLRTGDLSGHSGKGQHTTTFAELFDLGNGTKIIDTPGIKELGFINLEPQDVAHNFKELFEYSKNCRFNNCMHINEPNCAVLKAVEEHKISFIRYQSYVSVIEEVQSQNYWERKTDW